MHTYDISYATLQMKKWGTNNCIAYRSNMVGGHGRGSLVISHLWLGGWAGLVPWIVIRHCQSSGTLTKPPIPVCMHHVAACLPACLQQQKMVAVVVGDEPRCCGCRFLGQIDGPASDGGAAVAAAAMTASTYPSWLQALHSVDGIASLSVSLLDTAADHDQQRLQQPLVHQGCWPCSTVFRVSGSSGSEDTVVPTWIVAGAGAGQGHSCRGATIRTNTTDSTTATRCSGGVLSTRILDAALLPPPS